MAALWGDGFAGDGFAATCSMADWDGCSPDEYAMLFPRLVPLEGVLPPVLRGHLEACVAARAWRLAHLDPASPAPEIRARVPAASAAALHRAWFADDRAMDCLLRRMGLLRTSRERVAAERRLLALLDGVLDRVQRGLLPAWSEDREAWFAFGSGIHPAYLWPEGIVSPDRGCTAAWLGHLDRGRRALMPPAVADYLADAVLYPARARDPALAAMVGTGEDARRLGRAVALRRAGDDPTVAFGRGRHRVAAARIAARPAASIGGDALEHA